MQKGCTVDTSSLLLWGKKKIKLKIELKAVLLVQRAWGVKALKLLKYDSVIYINLPWVIQIEFLLLHHTFEEPVLKS